MGTGHHRATQRECAVCGREASAMKGETISIDPETLRWSCGGCQDDEVERVRAIVGD